MSSPPDVEPSNSPITVQISGIRVKTSRRHLESVIILVDGKESHVSWERDSKQVLRGTLAPIITLRHTLVLRPSHHRRFSLGKKDSDVEIGIQSLLSTHRVDTDRAGGVFNAEWNNSLGNLEIRVELVFEGNQSPPPRDELSSSSDNQLPSTAEGILESCPRFRILVIGKTGVGKSSIIKAAFGVEDVHVSDQGRGKADINSEFHSVINPRFVLHDSEGFEGGESDNLNKVKKFIQERRAEPAIKDKLHAIWLCLKTPVTGSRLLETGSEHFLTLKTNGELGSIPIIAIFTKYDLLVAQEEGNLIDDPKFTDLDDNAISEMARESAGKAMRILIEPFKELVKGIVPHASVSTQPGYEQTLADLIKLTFDDVGQHVTPEASIVSAVAQRLSPEVKMDALIAVGRKRYWQGLASSINFPGKTLKACIDVLHLDIVEIWDINDPHDYLKSKEFMALVSHMVDDSADGNPQNSNAHLKTGLSVVATVSNIVGGLSGPAAPIVIPIVACLVMARWVYDVYQNARATLLRLMTYIVNLALIMQIAFGLKGSNRDPVSRRFIKLACNTYIRSTAKDDVHSEITEFMSRMNFGDLVKRDYALDKVVKLIEYHRGNVAGMLELAKAAATVDLTTDNEPWDAQEL